MVHIYSLAIFISIWKVVNSEVSVISIESTKSNKEFHDIPIRTGIFGWFGNKYVCQKQMSPTELKKHFVEKFDMCPCQKPHQWVAKLARENKIDWESFKSDILGVPDEFPDYHGFLLVEDVIPRCSDNGELRVRISYRTNANRTYGRPEIFQSGGDSIYQLNTVHGIVSSANCTFFNGYGRCWAKHPMLFFRGTFSTHAPSPSKINTVGLGCALFGVLFVSVVVLLIVVWFFVSRKEKNRQKDALCNNGNDSVTFDI